jgi:hypothetical protein
LKRGRTVAPKCSAVRKGSLARLTVSITRFKAAAAPLCFAPSL